MTDPISLKLDAWVNNRVGELGGPVPLEEIFRAAVLIDPKVVIHPYIQYSDMFYGVEFPDGTEVTYGGEQQIAST